MTVREPALLIDERVRELLRVLPSVRDGDAEGSVFCVALDAAGEA